MLIRGLVSERDKVPLQSELLLSTSDKLPNQGALNSICLTSRSADPHAQQNDMYSLHLPRYLKGTTRFQTEMGIGQVRMNACLPTKGLISCILSAIFGVSRPSSVLREMGLLWATNF
jgi:hypothetical protein